MSINLAPLIVEAIHRRGWNIYRRGPAGGLEDSAKVICRGPVAALEAWVIFDLYPRISDSARPGAIRAFETSNSIELPRIIISGREISFRGIHLQDTDARFLSIEPPQEIVPYGEEGGNILGVLATLQDISHLL